MEQQSPPAQVGSNDELGVLSPKHGNGGGELTKQEAEALALLLPHVGIDTGAVAQSMPSLRIWQTNRRTQSQCALHALLRLEACGLARRMDNEKPIAWMLKTPNAGWT